MQNNKKIILLLVLLIPMFLLLSCLPTQDPPKVVVQPKPAEEKQRASVAKRFQESSSQIENPTVIESAMELSKKHAKLSEEAAVLRQQNKEHIVRNQQLENQVVALEAKLEQAQKELNEANELLMTMRIALNNWKVDVLGFRDEMRDAETAQLEALLKILKVLGGEVEAESAQGKGTGPEVASLSEAEQPK